MELPPMPIEKSLSELTTNNNNIIKNFDFLIIPKREKKLRLLYETYKTSEDTLNLLSEQNRQLFADNLLFEEPKTGVRKLYWMTIEIIANNFNGNAEEIYKNFDLVTQQNIWELVDLNLPILKTININSDIYWHRVFDIKSKNKYRIGEFAIEELNLNSKCLGMSEKLREIFENTSYEGWIDDNMNNMIKPIAIYIYYLRITKLIPIKDYSFDRDPNLLDYRMINYNKDECHHINLDIIGYLYQLTYLSFEFTPPKMGVNYQSRFFDFSTLDIVHLAMGIERLENLKTFKLRNSRMNNQKLEILIDALKSCPLENIELPYCQLNDECGYTLSRLFENNKTLVTMNLSGNYLCAPGMSSLCYGIQEYDGFLKNLNLSRNPITNHGLAYLARALNYTQQIEILNLCGIQISDKGCALLPSILKNPILKHINITALPIGEYLGDEIIDSIDKNESILTCDADECDLTIEQELKLKILIKRNNYIYDNPYIGIEITESKEGIPDLEVRKIKNKIYLKALEMFNNHQECTKILDENFKKKVPVIDAHIVRDSARTKDILSQSVPHITFDKSGKSERLLSLPKIGQNLHDEEDDYIKRCTFSTTFNQQYFEIKD